MERGHETRDMVMTRVWDWTPLSETYVHSPGSEEGGGNVGSVAGTSAISSPRSDSGLNSLEYWDYSVELECITGQQDLQLAAELGKTLLERNKELELSLKHQQSVIDDQNMEIEYLSKQASALRDMNESRMKIYEQLELSMIDLERGNVRLCEESYLDKEKIRSLTTTVQKLEMKCEELQRCLDNIVLRRTGGQEDRERITGKMFPDADEKKSSTEQMQETTCQVGQVCSIQSDDIENPDNNNDEGRDSPSTCTQESGYGSTCTDSLSYRDTCDNDVDTDTCVAQTIHAQTQTRDKVNENHLDAILEAEEVIRLTQEISCLREEIDTGDRQIKELEEQISSLISDNRELVRRLDNLKKLTKDGTRSSVEQEVREIQNISEGRLCRKCLETTETTDSSDLCWLILQTAKMWGSQIGPVTRKYLDILLSRLERRGPCTWLDTWLMMVTITTIVLGCVRAIINHFIVTL